MGGWACEKQQRQRNGRLGNLAAQCNPGMCPGGDPGFIGRYSKNFKTHKEPPGAEVNVAIPSNRVNGSDTGECQMITLCMHCRRLKVKENYWIDIDAGPETPDVSHGCCPDCLQKYYPDVAARRSNRRSKRPSPAPNGRYS